MAKRTVERATLLADQGIEGDAHAGPWHRQVSLLNVADVEVMRRNLPDPPQEAKGPGNREQGESDSKCLLGPGGFGENLGIEGIAFSRLGLGSRLQIGESAQLLISQIGKECHSPCAIYFRAGDCLMPRAGLFARVIREGQIKPGDPIAILEEVDRSLFQSVVLTISDRCSRGEAEDTAGPGAARLLRETGLFHIYRQNILPDEMKSIKDTLRHYVEGHGIDLIVTVGGTGFSPRDVTPEATRAVIERFTPGLDEAMRAASAAKTPHAILSRGVSGIRRSTLIVNLPGSRKAAVENLSVILPALPHALEKLRGDPSDCGVEDGRIESRAETQKADK